MYSLGVSFRLPFSFDADKLAADLALADKFQLSTHPLKYHNGQWQTLNLIYSGGRLDYTHEGQLGYGNEAPAPTPVLKECAYFREVLEKLPGKKRMARLSVLPPGGKVLLHYDPVESADFGFVRVHIPVVTDRQVKFHLARTRRRWSAGETWYGDFTFPHSVSNDSGKRRVHLIVDLELDDDMRAVMPKWYFKRAALRSRYRKFHRDLCWYEEKLKRMFSGGSQSSQTTNS